MKLPENIKLGRGSGYGRQAEAKFLSPSFSRHHIEHKHLCPVCITQPSPQRSETNGGRTVFPSLCGFQRQMRYSFFFSKWIPRYYMSTQNIYEFKTLVMTFFRFVLPNIFFWLASHKCLLLGWSMINHHILIITGVNSLSPLCCNWAAPLKASLLLPSSSQGWIIYSGTINAECKPGPCVMEGGHPWPEASLRDIMV